MSQYSRGVAAFGQSHAPLASRHQQIQFFFRVINSAGLIDDVANLEKGRVACLRRFGRRRRGRGARCWFLSLQFYRHSFSPESETVICKTDFSQKKSSAQRELGTKVFAVTLATLVLAAGTGMRRLLRT